MYHLSKNIGGLENYEKDENLKKKFENFAVDFEILYARPKDEFKKFSKSVGKMNTEK